MSPKPYIFINLTELISKLKKTQRKVDQFYNKKILDLQSLIKKYVTPPTYRAFRKSAKGKGPSVVFRSWAFQFLSPNIKTINFIKTQKDYDAFVINAATALCKHWKNEMKYEIGFGRAAKLLNLVLKEIPKYDSITKKAKLRLIEYLHIPLDSYSIRGLKKIIDYKIPSNASMGFIKDKNQYLIFQKEIRLLAKKAQVPPICYDLLSWNEAHKKRAIKHS